MNIRFDSASIRFRIDQTELESLIKNNVIYDTLFLPEEQKIAYSIHLVDRRTDEMKLIVRDNSWKFEIPKSAIENVQSSKPILDALVNNQTVIVGAEHKEIILKFEVDIKSHK